MKIYVNKGERGKELLIKVKGENICEKRLKVKRAVHKPKCSK